MELDTGEVKIVYQPVDSGPTAARAESVDCALEQSDLPLMIRVVLEQSPDQSHHGHAGGRRRRPSAGLPAAHRNQIGGDPCSFLAGSGRLATHGRDHISHKLNPSAELRQLLPFQLAHGARQLFDAASASGCHSLMAFRCRLNVRQPSVARVAFPFYETILLEARHDPGHRRRLHLFRARELTEGERSAEDDDREGRKSGGRKSAGVIFLSQLAQEMDRRRMELVGKILGLVTLRHVAGTSLIRPTTFPCPSESSQTQISRPFMRAMTRGSARLLAPDALIRACVFLMSLTS